MRASLRLTMLAAVCVAAALLPAAASAFGPVSSFGALGAGAGQFERPLGIAAAADGAAYVVDTAAARVSVFSPQGEFRFAFGRGVDAGVGRGNVCTAATGCQMGIKNGAASSINQAGHPAFGPDGNFYLPNRNNNRIDVFTPQGLFLYAFGKRVNPDGSDRCTTASTCQAGEGGAGAGAGLMSSPGGLEFGPEGSLYVADTDNNRIDVFTPQGAFLRAFGKGVDPAGANVCTNVCQAGEEGGGAGELAEPEDVAVDGKGTVYVSEEGNQRISAFGVGGDFRFAFGGAVNLVDGSNRCTAASGCRRGAKAEFAGGFSGLAGIALGAGGNLFVTEFTNARVSVFDQGGAFQRGFGAGVVTGTSADVEPFEICDLATGCEGGESSVLASAPPGMISNPEGIATDCHGAVYVTETISSLPRVERFAEPGTPVGAPCPVAAPPPPSNRIKVGKLVRNLRKGTATLVVSVPGPGRLSMAGRGLKKVTKAAAKAGTVKLPVRLLGTAKRKLARTGKAKVKAKLSFTPTGGTTASTVKALVLKKKAGHARRGGGAHRLERPLTDGFKVLGFQRLPIRGTGRLRVAAPGEGTLDLKGPGLIAVHRAVGRAAVMLGVNPNAAAGERLRKKGRMEVEVDVTFTPTGGAAVTLTKTLVLIFVSTGSEA